MPLIILVLNYKLQMIFYELKNTIFQTMIYKIIIYKISQYIILQKYIQSHQSLTNHSDFYSPGILHLINSC